MKNKYFILFLPIFFISLVSAQECGITNLASCISESLFNFLLGILNAPIQPLLDLVYYLLTQPVNIDIFSPIWSIIVYILSLFYGMLLMYVGFRFLISGHSVEQREKSKAMLANILIMMVLVQSSFYLYSLAIEVTSSVTTAVLNMVQQNFFLLTIDNIANIGLQFVFLVPYLTSVLITLILLTLRYMIVSAGVILFAVGVFFYFIEPLKEYGKLIINFLFATMSLTFFYAIVFLTSSKLLELVAFQNTKILIMIGAFSFVNLATIFLILFVVIKSALKVASPIMQVVSVVGAVAGA
ncbi:MAG: hypothetical protein WC533_04915 [Candidatus Pacearchaeota archaeon]